jgi:hypothetical protein
MTDNIYSDQMPNTYGDGYYDCLAFVADIVAVMQDDPKFDQATLDELIDRINE